MRFRALLFFLLLSLGTAMPATISDGIVKALIILQTQSPLYLATQLIHVEGDVTAEADGLLRFARVYAAENRRSSKDVLGEILMPSFERYFEALDFESVSPARVLNIYLAARRLKTPHLSRNFRQYIHHQLEHNETFRSQYKEYATTLTREEMSKELFEDNAYVRANMVRYLAEIAPTPEMRLEILGTVLLEYAPLRKSKDAKYDILRGYSDLEMGIQQVFAAQPELARRYARHPGLRARLSAKLFGPSCDFILGETARAVLAVTEP